MGIALIGVIVTLGWVALWISTWRQLWPRGEGALWRTIRRDPGFSWGFALSIIVPVASYVEAVEGAFPGSLVGGHALMKLAAGCFIGFPVWMWCGRVFGVILSGSPRDPVP